MPSSRVLEEVIHQALAEYVTVGWLISTLHRHSFGIIMLSLDLSAKPFCQGEPGAMGLSRMPMALSRCVAAAP
jgi:hypothetical protein